MFLNPARIELIEEKLTELSSSIPWEPITKNINLTSSIDERRQQRSSNSKSARFSDKNSEDSGWKIAPVIFKGDSAHWKQINSVYWH